MTQKHKTQKHIAAYDTAAYTTAAYAPAVSAAVVYTPRPGAKGSPACCSCRTGLQLGSRTSLGGGWWQQSGSGGGGSQAVSEGVR